VAMPVQPGLDLLLVRPAEHAYLSAWRPETLLVLGIFWLLSVGLAIGGSVVGILVSFHAGLASGASIVLCLGAAFLVSVLFSPRYGALRGLRLGSARPPAA